MKITDIDSYVHFAKILGMCYATDMRKTYVLFQAPSSLPEITIDHYKSSNTN